MDLAAGDEALLRVLDDPDRLRQRIGETAADCAERRLAELQAVRCLRDVREPTGLYTLEAGDRVRVRLAQGWSLLMRPAEEPTPTDGDGRLDWASVTRVTFIALEQQVEGEGQ